MLSKIKDFILDNFFNIFISILLIILIGIIIYIGYNFVYVKYMPITDSLSVYLPR